MSQCSSSFNPSSSPSVNKFISEHPHLTMLETQCKTMKDLKKIHAHLIKTNVANDKIAASRILAFCSPRDLNYAYRFFIHSMQTPTLFAWNTIIRAFSQSPTPEHAILLFIDMLSCSSVDPSRLTYPSVFKACAHMGLVHCGVQVHGRVVKLGLEFDEYVRNSIVNMYASCGVLSEAEKLFDESLEFDVVLWNSMIMGLVKCGKVGEGRRLFNMMPWRNTVSWNSMISGYVRNGKLVEGLELFQGMREEGIRPSEYTMVSLLNASAGLGALKQGEWLHDFIVKNNFELNSVVVTAIIDMYGKCGSVDKALQVFETSSNKGLSCWNSMIMGLATNGCENEALQLFSRLTMSSLKPDCVTFIAVLTACNHSGLVDEARYYFSLMTEKYGIDPSIKHFTCMVDVLGRAGLLQEAEDLILSMSIKPDAIIWSSLLSACRNYKDIEVAKRAAQHVLELDPKESSAYVLMSNIYAASRQFKQAIKPRLSMKERQIGKEPGCSLIEVDGVVHEFIASGMMHTRSKEIYSVLNQLGPILQEVA